MSPQSQQAGNEFLERAVSLTARQAAGRADVGQSA